MPDEQTREMIVRLQRAVAAAADDCALYVEALRYAVRTIDELRSGAKTEWTNEDTKKLEAIRALCLFF
jgi:hypothetical protein